MAQNKRIVWKSTKETAWFIWKDFNTIKAQLEHWVLAPRGVALMKTHVLTREASASWLALSTGKCSGGPMLLSEGQRPLPSSSCCVLIYLEAGSHEALAALICSM